MKNYATQAIRAYTELFQTGAIQSRIESDKLILNLKANVTGDILICISPNKKAIMDNSDVMELIRSDSGLYRMKELAFRSLNQKLNGLILVPQALVWLLNFGFYTGLYLLKTDQINELISQRNFQANNWPILIIFLVSTGTLLFGKTIGFKLLKPIFSAIGWVIRKIRQVKN